MSVTTVIVFWVACGIVSYFLQRYCFKRILGTFDSTGMMFSILCSLMGPANLLTGLAVFAGLTIEAARRR